MQYIANLRDGAVAGFKYFDFRAADRIAVQYSGKASGRMEISVSPDFADLCATIDLQESGERTWAEAALRIPEGVHPLYFRFSGSGALNFFSFRLTAQD